MTQVWAALDSAWRILAVALVLGAGLPALFSFGIRAMAWGTGGEAEIHDDGVVPASHPVGRWIAWAIFAVVVAIVGLGIAYITAHGLGMVITFDGIIPVFSSKG